jgi:hypothetical protein
VTTRLEITDLNPERKWVTLKTDITKMVDGKAVPVITGTAIIKKK